MTTTTSPASWTKTFAKESDAELARLSDIAYEANRAVEVAFGYIFNYAGSRTAYSGRTSFQSFDGGKSRATIEQVREIIAGTRVAQGRRPAPVEQIIEVVAKWEAAREAAAAAAKAANDHDRANYQGWGRFFLVPDGHIHRSTGCSSLRPTTRIGWLPELSGETEAEAVAAHGAMLCTKCFPSAPTEWTMGKAVPADQCAGSGTWDYPRETARKGYCSGNYGVCSHCNEKITISSTGKMRKHKAS